MQTASELREQAARCARIAFTLNREDAAVLLALARESITRAEAMEAKTGAKASEANQFSGGDWMDFAASKPTSPPAYVYRASRPMSPELARDTGTPSSRVEQVFSAAQRYALGVMEEAASVEHLRGEACRLDDDGGTPRAELTGPSR